MTVLKTILLHDCQNEQTWVLLFEKIGSDEGWIIHNDGYIKAYARDTNINMRKHKYAST